MKNLKKFENIALTLFAAAFFFLGSSLVHARSNEEKLKDTVDKVAESLKKEIDSLGDDISAVQKYLDNYHWKGVLSQKATSGVATVSDTRLNGHRVIAAVHPGDPIDGEIKCSFDTAHCSSLSRYYVVLGLKGVGPQEAIGTFGLTAGDSLAHFELKAPLQKGIYQLRFRTVEQLTKSEAMQHWLDPKGNEPDGTTTVGLIIVR
jgi:hypothetical protein